MGLVLREKQSEEDWDVITHWVDSRGRHWPTDSDNIPTQADGKPFKMGDNGHIQPMKEGDTPIRLRFWIKMLTGPESNAITAAVLKTRTRRSFRGRRNAPVEMEQDIDIGLSSRMKLKAALMKWEGITTEAGKEAPINDTYLDRLPAWLADDLVDHITSLTSITEEEEGE